MSEWREPIKMASVLITADDASTIEALRSCVEFYVATWYEPDAARSSMVDALTGFKINVPWASLSPTSAVHKFLLRLEQALAMAKGIEAAETP